MICVFFSASFSGQLNDNIMHSYPAIFPQQFWAQKAPPFYLVLQMKRIHVCFIKVAYLPPDHSLACMQKLLNGGAVHVYIVQVSDKFDSSSLDISFVYSGQI